MRFILFSVFCLLLTSCAKEFLNPYDPATPPDSWMPRDFVMDTLDNNSVRLSWQQDELHIDGYTVRRDVSGEIREFTIPFDSLRFTDLTVIDSTATDTCSEVAYSVMARAGDNLSSPVGNDAPLYLPLSAPAFAGADITVTDTATSVTLSASEPQNGERGEWTIVSGTGGVIADPTDPTTAFTGQSCTSYTLRWTITGCGQSSDEVSVSFQQQTTQANAGQDIVGNSLTVNLAANPVAAWETGQWSIVFGTGGSFSDASLHNTMFTGVLGETYLLRWQITGVCSSSTDEVAVTITPETGDTYQGGIIFYLDGNGGGLIAAPADQSTGAPWGCYGTEISGANGTAVGTGNQNTTDIVLWCTGVGTAAYICADLTLNGYNDWFLPSRDELQLMYQNLHAQGLGNFSNANLYWSSTESTAYTAWQFNFGNGNALDNYKSNTYYVRAVRAF